MNVLYIGDVMAEMGIAAVEKVLPGLRKGRNIDVVVAQAENVSEGKGLSVADYERLRTLGVDVFTGGNHTTDRPELFPLLEDPSVPVAGPANMHDCPGPGYKYVTVGDKRVLVISLLGGIVGKHSDIAVDNPLQTIDKILSSQVDEPRDATIVNFHGDYSSEKVIIGYYLDGRVSAVVGDHWHVPTADAEVLPKGTAHITDVGMCGSLDSSLGVTFESVIPRWRDGHQTKNEITTTGRSQFNALLVTINETTGKATAAEHIRQVW
ncbi:MAG TPA: TIGR00282 family metallophosphoesterase [Candidatus Saccharimonadales bacterium]|nr:TIGR00282 family metallophosphoesterase [Candidatus Saccharimonadales bacterium]